MDQSVSLITAATVDHVSQAVVTLKSARKYGNYRSYHIFFPDAFNQTINELKELLADDVSWIDIFGPDDLGPEKKVLIETFAYYTKSEIANLAKYFGLMHIVGKQDVGDICLFVDGDVLFYGDVAEIVQQVSDHTAMLTPHLIGPGDNSNDEHEILIHGWINAGVLIFNRKSPKITLILQWLINRISRRGFYAPALGMNFDQTWVSGLPLLFSNDIILCNNSGVNVAYWNIHQRPISFIDNRIFAGNDKLLILHLSGFDTKNPSYLTKHLKIKIEEGSYFEKMINEYLELIEQHAELKNASLKLSSMPASTKSLYVRLQICENRYGEKLYKTMPREGFFTKIGYFVDAVFRKIND